MSFINKKIRFNLLAIFSCFLWSTAFVGVKIVLEYSRPFSVAGIRFIIAGLMLVPFCGNFILYLKTVYRNLKLVLILAFMNTFILYGLFFWGMTIVDGSLGAIIVGSSPLIAAVVAHIFVEDDKLNFRRSFILGMGILGIIIISLSRQPWTESGLRDLIGIVLLLVGSIFSAFSNLIVKRSDKNISPMILNSSQIFIGGVLLFVLSLFVEGTPRFDLPLRFYITLFWLAFLSAAAFSTWFYLLKQPGVKISELNVWKFVIPVFGAGLSWLMLPDEFPTVVSIAGTVLVAVSIILFNLKNSWK